MASGFGLTRHCGLRPFARTFAEAGYTALLFDYRYFGDSEGTPRQVLSIPRQLDDWSAAIAFARSRPEVDEDRIATWGFSLGAGHALTAASRDPRVQAVIAVTPMFSGLSSTLAAARHWSILTFLRIIGRGLKDFVGSLLGRQPTFVPMTAPAGEFGILTSPDAYLGYRLVVPKDFDFNLAARIALVFWAYVPGRLLRRFPRPVLVLPSTADQINPARATVRRARRCPSARIVELDCEHMEAHVEPNRGKVVRATLDFLRGHGMDFTS